MAYLKTNSQTTMTIYQFYSLHLREYMHEVLEEDPSGELLKQLIDTENSLALDCLEDYISDVIYVVLNNYKQNANS